MALLEEQLRADLLLTLEQEELLWLQKSRNKWLADGDRNTRFFHISTLTRRKKNKIDRLCNDHGQWIEDQRALKELVVDYFKDIFAAESSEPPCSPIEGSFPRVDNDISIAWERVNVADIRNALFGVGALKAPRIDGLPAGFFQKHWATVKSGMVDFILGAFARCSDIANINETLIVLIPKLSNPARISQFRLCSVVYKTITKIIANEIKPLLPSLVARTNVVLSLEDK